MHKNKWLLLIVPLIALALECLPYGAVLYFADPAGEPVRQVYSYFSLLPFGYANFGPLLTAVVTCLMLLFSVIHCFSKHPAWYGVIVGCSAVSLFTSFLPLVYGFAFYTIIGAAISVLFITQLILLYLLKSKDKISDF